MDKPSLKASWDFVMKSSNRNDSILKSLALTLLAFVPIINYIAAFVSLDYKLKVMKASIAGEQKLPELDADNLGEKIVNGLKYYIVILIYSLPFVFILTALLVIFFIPIMILPALANDGGIFLLVVICASLLFTILLSLASTFWNSFIVLPATYLYLKKEDIGEALNVNRILSMKAKTKALSKEHFMSTLIVNTGLMLLTIISAFLLLICIGIIPYVVAIILGYLLNLFVFPHYEGKIFKLWDTKEP